MPCAPASCRPKSRERSHEHLKTCPSCDDSVTDVGAARPQHQVARRRSAALVQRRARRLVRSSAINGDDVWVAFSDRGHADDPSRGSFDEFSRRVRQALRPHAEIGNAAGRAAQAGRRRRCEGEGVDKPRVDWSDELTDLERDVLGTLTKIPRGEVRTYEWVARQVGRPRAVRAVGNILAQQRRAAGRAVPPRRSHGRRRRQLRLRQRA